MFTLPDLPYAYDALAPALSDRTLHFHHDKHHATYVKTLNELLDAAGKAPASLEEVIIASSKAGEAKLYDNAAQAWNHAFFWISMTPEAEKPEGDLAAAIEASFGGLAKLREAFVAQGAAHFGSGWLWLVAGPGKALEVRALHDAKDTVTDPSVTPLLVCDLWEHAYYLDYQNDRKAFLEAWFDALPNWAFAAAQLEAAGGGKEAWRHPAPSGDEASARAA